MNCRILVVALVAEDATPPTFEDEGLAKQRELHGNAAECDDHQRIDQEHDDEHPDRRECDDAHQLVLAECVLDPPTNLVQTRLEHIKQTGVVSRQQSGRDCSLLRSVHVVSL